MAEGKKEKLTAELEKINFYGRELSAGKSEAELEKLVEDLKQARQTIKSIFPFGIMG
jgi:hypothetical protein